MSEPSLAVMVACGPTLGPLIAALRGHVSTQKASSDNYPSYPERHQEFSNISESEYPLQPMLGNYSKADSKQSGSASAFMGTSQMKHGDRDPKFGGLASHVRPPDITVERDVSVIRSAQEPPLSHSLSGPE